MNSGIRSHNKNERSSMIEIRLLVIPSFLEVKTITKLGNFVTIPTSETIYKNYKNVYKMAVILEILNANISDAKKVF
jgi:hypothetical protein